MGKALLKSLFLLLLMLSMGRLEAGCLGEFAKAQKPARAGTNTAYELRSKTPKGFYIGVLHRSSETGEKSLRIGPYFDSHHRDIAEALRKFNYDEFLWAGEIQVVHQSGGKAVVRKANEVAGMVQRNGLEGRNSIETLEDYLQKQGLLSEKYQGYRYKEDSRHLAEYDRRERVPSNSTIQALLQIRAAKNERNLRHDFRNIAATIHGAIYLLSVQGHFSNPRELLKKVTSARDYIKMRELASKQSHHSGLSVLGSELRADLELLSSAIILSLQEKRDIDLDRLEKEGFSPQRTMERIEAFSEEVSESKPATR
jgi:hypothetical protein